MITSSKYLDRRRVDACKDAIVDIDDALDRVRELCDYLGSKLDNDALTKNDRFRITLLRERSITVLNYLSDAKHRLDDKILYYTFHDLTTKKE